jgi:LacI family transcriptional regulator
MSPQKNYQVGIRLPDWNRGYGNRLFGGIRNFVQSGHKLGLEFDQPSASYFEPVRIDEDWEGDGLLVYRYQESEAKAWKKRGIPVINLSTEEPETGPKFPRVTLDNHAAGRLAAQHLAALGVPDFAFWHDPGRQYSQERLAGFQAELERHNMDCRILEIPASRMPPGSRHRQIATQLNRALKNLSAPCGLFAKDDLAGVSTIRAVQKMDLRCPDDIAVLGVSDDIVHCHLALPALSSLRFPGSQLGIAAAQLLYRMMEGAQIPEDYREVISSPGVVTRESTRYVELPDPLVSRALSLIRQEAPSGQLTAHNLYAMLEVSRESLRKRFHETLGRTVKEEIDRVRADHVSELLTQTETTQEQIAQSCGFTGGDELCRFFKRIKGITPKQWRSQPH